MFKKPCFLGVLIIALLTIFSSPGFALPVWVPLLGDPAPEGSPPTITVDSWTTNTTVLNVDIHGFWEEDITAGFPPVVYRKLRLPAEEDSLTSSGLGNHGYLMNTGKSELPVIRVFLGVITDATTITTTLVQEISPPITLPAYTVYPFQKIVGIGDTIPPFEREDSHYFSTQWYPYDPDTPPYSDMQYPIGMWHHCPVGLVNIYPFFAVPGTNTVRVQKQLRITLSHNGVVLVDLYNCSKAWAEMYIRSIVNFEHISHVFPGPTMPQKPWMLIYAPHSFQSSSTLDEFITWKKRKGLSVTVKDSDDYTTDSDKLKADIKNFYDAHPCYDIYVLLIGDLEQIHPMWYAFMKDGSAYTVYSDYLFTRVNGNDDYGDIFIGRFPAKNVAEMELMLDKTLTYEETPPSGDWPFKCFFCAHWDDTSHNYPQYKHNIKDATYDIGPLSVTEVYGNQVGVSNTNIINGINAHVGFVNYNGHGDWDCWYQWHKKPGPTYDTFYRTDLDSLTNGDYLPIVFSTACYNSQFHITDNKDTISEAWLKKSDKGAVAALGSDSAYWTYPGHEFDRVLFCKIFGTKDHTRVQNLGMLNSYSHMSTIAYWNDQVRLGNVSSQYKNLASINAIQCVLYGDPNLTIRNTSSRNIQVFRQTEDVPPDNVKITYTVYYDMGHGFSLLISGASVTLENVATGQIMAAKYTDAGGVAAITVTKVPSILATIFAQNFYPYQETINFGSQVEDWKTLNR